NDPSRVKSGTEELPSPPSALPLPLPSSNPLRFESPQAAAMAADTKSPNTKGTLLTMRGPSIDAAVGYHSGASSASHGIKRESDPPTRRMIRRPDAFWPQRCYGWPLSGRQFHDRRDDAAAGRERVRGDDYQMARPRRGRGEEGPGARR